MADDGQAALARAAARIAELERELAQATRDAAGAHSSADSARAQLSVAKAELDAALPRLAELEKLMTVPPAASGIVLVTYKAADGRQWQKYAAPDGTKHTSLPDAEHRMQLLALMNLGGMTEIQAEAALANRDGLVKALSIR